MADLIISEKQTTPQSLTVTSASEKLTIEPAGSVIVELTGAGGKSPAYAVQSTAGDKAGNTITLDGAISIKDVTTDPDQSTYHNTYGLLVANTATTGTTETHADYTATIKTDNASTIDVTRDTTSQQDVEVSGIGSKNSDTSGSFNAALLVFGDGNGTFQDAVTVSATNSNVDKGSHVIAYGIRGDSSVITFKDKLAAAINVTATQNTTAAGKMRSATALGISGAKITFENDISSAITATATSKTFYSYAIAIQAQGTDLVIGTEEKEADLAGTITVEATGAGSETTATGLNGSNVYIYGSITKNITATASGENSGKATAYGLQSGGSGAVSITGKVEGAIKATATAKTNTAGAYGISGGTAATIGKGITQDITATATGAATAESETTTTACGINSTGAVTIGTKDTTETAISGTITATATGNATLSADEKTAYAGHADATGINGASVTLNGDVTGDITAAATANKVTASDGTVVGGTAYAYGINASGAVSITGKVEGAINATAIAEANAAKASGIIARTVTVTKGITKDITATATGAATADNRTNTFAYGIDGHSTLTIGDKNTSADLAGTITAKATGNATLTGDKTKGYGGSAYAYGIAAENNTLTIYGNVTKNITATATANKATQVDNGTQTDVSGWTVAYGISASNNAVSITGTLAGAIEATATAKTNLAAAIAIIGNAVKIDNGITKDITATATGAATASENCDIDAYGIQAICNKDATGITIGTSDNKADLAGAITATATGSATLSADEKTAYAGNANAYAIYAYNGNYANGKVTINGDVTGDITATSMANSKTQSDGTVVSGTATAYGIYTFGAVSVTGALAGAVNATAIAEANNAKAYGICASSNDYSPVTISKGITQDITATATGAGFQLQACGIYSGKVLTIGADLAGAITATATNTTATGGACANVYGLIGDTVKINGNVTKAITVTAISNNVGTCSASADAYGIYSGYATDSEGIGITGAVNAAIKVTSVSAAHQAMAYGIDVVQSGKEVSIANGIAKDITITAIGTAKAGDATDPAKTGSSNTSKAYGICTTSSGAITIGGTATDTAIGGDITVKATGSAKRNAKNEAEGYAGNADAYGINGASVTLNGDVTGDITAAATANKVTTSDGTVVGGTAYAYGIKASGALNITGALAGNIKAAAVAKSNTAYAYGIYASTEAVINAINATITATANGGNGTCSYAYCIKSDGNGLTVKGGITEAITAKVTSASFQAVAAKGYGISGAKVDVGGDITGAVTVTVTANSVEQANGYKLSGSAAATGINGSCTSGTGVGGISISGTLAGDIKVTATNKANLATADGLFTSNGTDVTVTGGITGAITATATGTANVGTVYAEKITAGTSNTQAYGIRSDKNTIIGGTATTTAIGGDITATATGSAMLGYDGTVYEGYAVASAIKAKYGAVTIDGNVTGDMTATAKANSLAQAGGEVVCGTATASGISASGAVSIDGDVTGDITATATSEANTATAYGIYAEGNIDLTGAVSGVISATATSGTTAAAYACGIYGEGSALNVGSDLGTVRVSAAGIGYAASAIGIFGNSLTYTGDRLTANVAVKSSASASGINVGSITKKDGTAGVAKLNVSVTSDALSAVGLTLNDEADLTLQESSITAHASQAASLYGSENVQKIMLEKSTLTGGVSLLSGSDTLTLKSSSMITGDVYMGDDDTDTLTIFSGSRITGDVKSAESTTLVLNDLSYASSVLWEGTMFEGGSLTLNFSSEMLKGVTNDGVTFNLLKDTDSEWTGTSAILCVDGSSTAKTLEQETSVEYGNFKYLLSTGTDKKTLTVTVTRISGEPEGPGVITDTDKPTISVDTSASTFTQGDTLWFQQGAVATVKGTDATSGVHYLTRTEGDWKYNIAGDTAKLDLELELNEAATVSYTATDKAGNVSDAATVKYNVDGSEPTITGAAVSGATEVNGAYWVKQGAAATVGATVTDAKSGVKSVQFNGGTVVGADVAYSKVYDTSTEHDLTDYAIAATDNVGNAASETLQIGVDGTPVEISFSTTGADAYVGETGIWVNSEMTLTLAAAFTDALSGVNTDSVKLNGETIALGAGDEYTEILALKSGNDLEWKLSAKDNAGNELEKTVKIGVDETAPDVSQAVIKGDHVFGQWVKAGTVFTVDMTAADTQSGVASTTLDNVKYDGRTFEVTAGTVESEIVEHEISAVDNVGNESKKGTISYGIDGTGPKITLTNTVTATVCNDLTLTGAPDSANATKTASTVDAGTDMSGTYTSDWFSAVDKDFTITIEDQILTKVTVNGAEQTLSGTSFDYTFSNLVQGANVYEIVATDGVGNETTSTITLNYDSESPVFAANSITIEGVEYAGQDKAAACNNPVIVPDIDSFTVTLNATDTSSLTNWYSFSANGTNGWTEWTTADSAITSGEGYYRFATVDAAGNTAIADKYFYIADALSAPAAKVNNFNNTGKSDMVQVVNSLVYVMYDTESGYIQTPAINDVTGWNVVETRRDLTGDGLADIQITSDDGAGSTWVAVLRNDYLENGCITLNYQFIGAYNNELWNYLGSADVNGDGKSEVLMIQTDDGLDAQGHRNVAAWVTDETGTWVDNEWVGALVASDWNVAGTADLDGNGTDNVILRRADGMIGYWSEAGTNEVVKIAESGQSVLISSGDFDGDKADDLLFTNASGDFFTWSDIGGDLSNVKIGNLSDLGESWSFAGTGDYNGDGMDELLWCDGTHTAYSEADKDNFSKLVQIA